MTMNNTQTTPFMHLQPNENVAQAKCGCVLQYCDDGNAQIFHCSTHAAAPELREALEGLVDLANDPVGSRYTLAEVFGTFHKRPEIEGKTAIAAIARAANHEGVTP